MIGVAPAIVRSWHHRRSESRPDNVFECLMPETSHRSAAPAFAGYIGLITALDCRPDAHPTVAGDATVKGADVED